MNIENLVRKNIKELKPYSSARGSHLTGILLDANENAIGSVIDDFNDLGLNRYPDPNQNRIREKLSLFLNVDKNNLFFGVGSDEIIDLLIRIFCSPKENSVIIPQPTYGMYEVACNINEVEIINSQMTKSFQLNIEEISNLVRSDTKLIFLCSPNNPTGNLLKREDIITLLKIFNGIIIVDEAYIDFSEESSLINEISNFNNLVILRTFSKAWGLAGVRCGYAVANKFIIELLFKIKAPYNLNKLTEMLILNALANYKKKNQFVEIINNDKKRVVKELARIEGIEIVFPSDSNFILFKCRNADNIYKELIKKGIIIRNRSNQVGLNDCLRLTVGTFEENNKFLETLKEIL